MQIALLHVSDIHLYNESDAILQRADTICNAIISRLGKVDAFFIVTTGDIVWSGCEKQYLIAIDFYNSIINKINDHFEIETVFISVPGNHDCDFTDAVTKEINEIIIGNLSNEEEISDAIVTTLMKAQEPYYAFTNMFNNSIGKGIFRRLVYPVGNKEIVFNLVNTAWMSSIHEKEGTLLIPTNELTFNDAHDLSISLWHHPTRWFNCENDKKFRGIIESNSDLIMIGHEHIAEHMQIIKKDSNIKYFFGGALQDKKDDLCSFNLLDITLDEKYYYYYHFNWDKGTSQFEVDEEEGGPLVTSFSSLYLSIDKDFYNELMDFGMSIMHPRCEHVKLEHLYIYPDIDVFSLDDDARLIKSNEVEKYLSSKDAILLYGVESSGKTAIAKKTFISLVEQDIYPVILGGSDITTAHIKHKSITKLLEDRVKEQYGESATEKYLQISLEGKAVIIDDFQHCKLNQQGKVAFLNNLGLICKKIIILINGSYHSQFIEERNIYARFTVCQIKEFGHKLRFDLIKKWILLGQEFVVDDRALLEQCYNTENLINTVIGKKYIPTYPSYIILLLQQSSQAKLKDNTSTHGHLYDFLIKGTLLKNGFEPKELDKAYTFLSILAYYMFSSKNKSITESALVNQLNYYNSEYDMQVGKDFIARLMSAKIIKISHNEYSFNYLYFYYFFVAFYLNTNFDKDAVNSTVTDLLDKLYLDDYGNIIIFLCHFNKSERLFTAIADKARSVFPQNEQYSIDTHNEFIRSIQDQIQYRVPIMLPSSNIEKNKEESLAKRDMLDEELESNDVDKNIDYESDDPYMNDIKSLNSGFRTIEVIGHIIKNYAGSIDRENKMMLLDECFKLGMRSLKFQMDILQDMIEPFIEFATKICQEEKIALTSKEISERTNKLIFDLCFFFAYGQIRVISQAIASEDLLRTYERISTDNNDSALTLVLQSATLNDLRRLEPSTLLGLAESFKRTNPFCFNLLRRMAYDHLYFNKCEISVRQRISDKLNFKSSTIDLLTSPENKNALLV